MDLVNQYILDNFVNRNRKGKTVNTETATRPLWKIAIDIRAHWPKVYFGAVPYLRALDGLSTLNDSYGMDDARGVVRYFLANSGTWRGDHVRRIKAELRSMLGE